MNEYLRWYEIMKDDTRLCNSDGRRVDVWDYEAKLRARLSLYAG